MILPPLFGPVRPSLRLVAATLLPLLVLSPAETCSAAEVTLAGKYSLQLPDGWKAPIQSKTELEGEGPGKAKLWAGVFETDKPVEEIQAEEVTGFDSQAGYKVIERGSVKHSSGSKGQLSRFQSESKGQTIVGVGFSLRFTPKEVVLLVVRMPAESMTTAKSDIQAIFNSIKPVAAASASEDSWVTAPADKSKESSKGPSSGYSQVAGQYVSSRQSSDHIVLKADGTFSGEIQGESHTGTYTRNGTTISFKFGETVTEDLKLEKDALVDKKGYRWVKSTAPAAPSEKSNDPETANADMAWPCAVDQETRSTVAKAKLRSPTTMPDSDSLIRFPTGWIQDTEKAENRTFVAFTKADGLGRIAVFGRTTATLADYVASYKQGGKSEFRGGTVCPYQIAGGPSGSATVFQVRKQAGDDWQIHTVFAFPRKSPTSAPEITLVDCITSREIGPEYRGIFEACLQSLKLPSASSR